MSRLRSPQYDNQDEIFWDSGQEFRKQQTAGERCKQKRTKSIRQGINDYWDRQTLRQNIADSFEDISDNWEESDNWEDNQSEH
ncbi:hypothetical protein EOPP23_02770 [Endozoicomonas sp. OPT23]|uniref:hypothetical protein n=1 Tax=Endozoicomonas sp. OPT23 TaxID=2072845 RepID=UPI00129A74E0|nr:hypothetical protein [Endozoicomonas sp. OPT23]MRI31920.1 hypothetical protein [Endozoicomonas sp. OPT23]